MRLYLDIFLGVLNCRCPCLSPLSGYQLCLALASSSRRHSHGPTGGPPPGAAAAAAAGLSSWPADGHVGPRWRRWRSGSISEGAAASAGAAAAEAEAAAPAADPYRRVPAAARTAVAAARGAAAGAHQGDGVWWCWRMPGRGLFDAAASLVKKSVISLLIGPDSSALSACLSWRLFTTLISCSEADELFYVNFK